MSTPLTWIRSFESAARNGSLTMAALDINLTQAAVSQQIRALENRLGVQLFHREPRGVSLTGAGTELYSDLAKGLNCIDGAIARFSQKEYGELKVLCNTSFAQLLLIPLLPSFCTEYPDITLSLRTALWKTDALGVNADVELFLGSSEKSGASQSLPHSGMVIIVAPQHATSLNSPESDDRNRVITVTGFEAMFNSLIETVKQKDGYSPLTLEVDSFISAISLAQKGLGMTICPRLLVLERLEEKLLIETNWSLKLPNSTYWCDICDEKSFSGLLFRDWLFKRFL